MIVFPNAKINIGLFVTEKRADGFHNLETVFYPIGLSDILEILAEEGKPGECFFENTGIDIDCGVEKNLIVKSYHLLAAQYRLPAVYVHLHKLIPFGAGLGGGSADAAFMLKALNDYFDLHIKDRQLSVYASALGSDCTFFVRNRPVFAFGKGDQLEDIGLDLSGYKLVLIKPDFGVSTPEAYAGICPRAAGFDLRHLQDLPIKEWRNEVINDFEKSVFARYPRLACLKQYLYDKGACYASMTGSGSALYGLFGQTEQVEVDCPGCFVWQS